ncbi:hypothetical protein B0H34DRAFT_792972 [Crassisporium funariophilum]|nr:hypothetical protein B0H34DRAFT_792972 [Crassisporium funariophilum]
MDAYPEVTPLWDLSHNPTLTQLADSDFLALLHKQFSTDSDGLNYMTGYPAGVNPQNVSTYSLPSLTPPSEDSSPSPPNSNQDHANDDINDAALKRKASDDDLSDGPSSKTQHTSENDKKNSAARRKSSGGTGTGKDENRLMKRKEQNRAAQRAFRERKEKHVKDLEDKVADLEAKNEQAQNENENLRDLLTRLQSENVALKETSFTFAVPKNAASTTEPPKAVPQQQNLFSSLPSPTQSSVASPSLSGHPSPKVTNPLDWSSLTTFDPAMLNLLDDSVPQPTATEGAMQMDFGFGGTTGLASNAPYTTIASNPMFMSFASTFDSLSPPSMDAGSSSANTFSSNNGFNFDMNALSTWPTPSSSQDAILDDLFAGYLGSTGSVDYSMLGQSPASISPVTHNTVPSAFKPRSSPGASSSSLSSLSSPATLRSDSMFTTPRDEPSPGSDVVHSKDTCPKTKSEYAQHINAQGASPFAPAGGTIQKTSSEDNVLGKMITCAGSKFPSTQKSDSNIEVLSAWRSITSNPKFKDFDLNELCSEFSNKARCDGSKVVLEPQGVHSILETLAKKQ